MSTPPDALPDDKFTPSTILDPYRAEIERLRGLLVKACCMYARRLLIHSTEENCVEYIEAEFGIRIRWKDVIGFEEDTTK